MAGAPITLGDESAPLCAPAPRIIWTYWNSKKLPALVEASILSWQFHHPDFTVRVLNDETIGSVLGFNLDETVKWLDSPTRRSDVIRINTLARHGGVWLDGSFLVCGRLKFLEGVLGDTGPDFVGWYLEGWTIMPQWPVVENWAFAARPGSPFMAAWRDEFMSTPNHAKGVAAQVAAYAGRVNTQKIPALHYLLMHVAAQAVMQGLRPPLVPYHLQLFPAEQGPYKYLADKHWKSWAATDAMVDTFRPRRPGLPVYDSYKMRGRERVFTGPCKQAKVLQRIRYAIMDGASFP
jgi:hypothetical protein